MGRLALALVALAVLAASGAFAGDALAQEALLDTAAAAEAPVLLDGEPAEAPAEAASPAAPGVGWLAVLPAVLAIAAALAFRQVVAALFLGVWLGAWIVTGDPLLGWFTGLFDTVAVFVLGALANEDHAAIILFTLMIGGAVGLIQRNGGTSAIVDVATRWARSAGRGQLATAILGTAIFFDDYANTLIVGGTMRPITDRLRISREKLAYLVDSTAAPVASLALVTTWIGYEVGLIGTAIDQLPGYDEGAYSVFLNSIPYSFYPILTLLFVFLIAGTRRDFGPMREAERRARRTGQLYRPGSNAEAAQAEADALAPPPDAPRRLVNAVLPIVVLVAGVLVGLVVTGRAAVAGYRGDGDDAHERDRRGQLVHGHDVGLAGGRARRRRALGRATDPDAGGGHRCVVRRDALDAARDRHPRPRVGARGRERGPRHGRRPGRRRSRARSHPGSSRPSCSCWRRRRRSRPGRRGGRWGS